MFLLSVSKHKHDGFLFMKYNIPTSNFSQVLTQSVIMVFQFQFCPLPPKILMFNIIQINKLHTLQTLLYLWQFSHAIHSKLIYLPLTFECNGQLEKFIYKILLTWVLCVFEICWSEETWSSFFFSWKPFLPYRRCTSAAAFCVLSRRCSIFIWLRFC